MIIDRPAVDYLTLTTFSLKTVIQMVDALEPLTKNKDAVAAKEGAYDGMRGEGFFIGHGEQRGKEHHKFRMSGDLSDAFTWQVIRPPIDCTRIDLQLTLPLPCDISESFDQYIDLMRVTEASEENRGQRKRKVDGVVHLDGYCTMYVGSRESQRFYRLYVKENSGINFVRFEVEFKDKKGLAGRVWRDTARKPESIVTYLKGEIDTLPDHPLILPFKKHLAGVPGEVMKLERRIADPQKTLAWLRRQVSPAMKRLIANHDTSDAAMFLLLDWLKFANGLDDI